VIQVQHNGGRSETIVRFLKRHLKVTSKNGLEWQALCPYHDDKTPSFSVNIRKGLFICYACGAKGNMKQLAEHLQASAPMVHEPTIEELEAELANLKQSMAQADRPIVGLKVPPIYTTPEATRVCQEYFGAKRNLNTETIERYRLCADTVHNEALIPVCDLEGRIAFFIRRAIDWDGAGLKYRYPKGAKVSEYLFGADIAKKWFSTTTSTKQTVLVITEGTLDAMSVDNPPVKRDVWNRHDAVMCGVAVMGAKISETQAHLVQKLAPSLIFIGTDSDRAGREAAMQIENALRAVRVGGPFVHLAWSNNYKDLNELPEDQLLETLDEAFARHPLSK
jgi:DNA primase